MDGDTARAELVLPAGDLTGAGPLVAVEAMHQIACRLAARARGAARCVPARLDDLRTDPTAPVPAGAMLRARLLRSGRLSTVRTELSVQGRLHSSATVRTQEVT
ncbi:hypothetical protein GCM10020256_34620 [Streptomyces thermocoprophilus]